MQLIDSFTTEIYVELLDTVNSDLIPKILEYKETHPSVSKSNEGGWQSDIINFDEIDWLLPLISETRNKIQNVFDNYGILNEGVFKYWMNVNEPGNSNVKHRHTDGTFSGVIYIKVPENSGDIVFHRENMFFGSLMYITPKTKPAISLSPQEGGLLLFPCFLDHEVTENKSQDTRISIAFNVR